MTRIVFEFDTEFGTFRDALMLPEDHTYTNEEIETMKQERFNNWHSIIKPQLQTEEQVAALTNG